MQVKSTLIALALCLGMVGASISKVAHAVILTDIVMIVDESGSMGNVQANLRNNIGTFASILSAGGVDAQYGLVGYGNGAVDPRQLTDLTTAANFATAAAGLVASGGTEPGYAATAFALNSLEGQLAADLFSFRANALKNIIIFTDEPNNGSAYTLTGGILVTEMSIDILLGDNNALFNAVLRGTNTINSYEDLALDNGGLVFDLNGLNTNDPLVVSAFVTDFADKKLQEILDFCDLNPTDPACTGTVPEPSIIALFAVGLLGLGFARRRMQS